MVQDAAELVAAAEQVFDQSQQATASQLESTGAVAGGAAKSAAVSETVGDSLRQGSKASDLETPAQRLKLASGANRPGKTPTHLKVFKLGGLPALKHGECLPTGSVVTK